MKTMTSLLLAVFFLFGTTFGQRETRLKNQSSYVATTGDEVLHAARQIQEKAGKDGWRFLRDAKNTNGVQNQMLDQIRQGKALIDRVTALGDKITDKQAAVYDRQMIEIVKTMDKLHAINHASGGQGECFGGCDGQYKGWGHGKGWNRFWCKVSCFKIEIHVG